ncbi:response regulator transcription factor [Hydrocarboniphaga sp.]|uniref:response regulator transcription factor n=1 Tax=Hydrocarboniphaga sp. TaxID=2033016 RepID=UPI003D13CBAE
MTTDATVFVVDDDEGVRSGLRVLLASGGLRAQLFASAQAFLAEIDPAAPGCLLLDVRMPGISGLDLQERLQQREILLPVILLTGHGDVPMAVRAMKRGAFDFIQKPFNDQYLLDRISEALELDGHNREHRRHVLLLKQRLARLTARERSVLDGLVKGQANKSIASDLGISERTVELHRAHVMEKMEARSLAQLVQALATLKGE